MFGVSQEEGPRGSTLYHIGDGLCFHLDMQTVGRSYLKCVLHQSGCRGRALFDPCHGFVHTREHNHEPDIHLPAEMELRRKIIQRYREQDEQDQVSLKDIIAQERKSFPLEVQIRVSYNKMRYLRNAF